MPTAPTRENLLPAEPGALTLLPQLLRFSPEPGFAKEPLESQ